MSLDAGAVHDEDLMSLPLLAVAAFAAATTVTPGPNNAMVAASAARHGVRATLPHCLGIAFGFAAMVALVGLGVAGFLIAAPAVMRVLRWVALAWLLLLAWRIARSGAPGSGPKAPPMSFLGAALFQWVNPKAWLIAVGGNAAFVTPGAYPMAQVALLAGTFLVLALPCILLWAAFGSAAGRVLSSPLRLRVFNVTMAALMVASMLPAAFE